VRKLFLFALMAAALLAVLVPAGAYAKEKCCCQKMMMMKEIASEAKITDEQLKMLMEAHMAMHKEMIQTKADLEIKEMELKCQLCQDKPDAKMVTGLVKEIGELKTRKSMTKVQMVLKFKELLTPEQRKALMTIMKTKMEEKKKATPCSMRMHHHLHGAGMTMDTEDESALQSADLQMEDMEETGE